MKIFVSFLLILISIEARAACTFKSEVKRVISLSGSMTVLMKNTGLIHDKKFYGISVFNPVDERTFKGKVFPGGLFISQSALQDFSGSIVFYDKGTQIKKILSSQKNISATVEVSTRDLLPMEVVERVISLAAPYVSGCDEAFDQFKFKSLALQNLLFKKIPPNFKVIFFMGAFRGENFPEFVISNDGVVKLLKTKKIIQSYPSDLAYVNWSARVMSELPKDTLFVAIADPGMKHRKEIKRSSQRMTVTYPGALVPGHSQLEAFLYWAENLN
jgi:hypothetical protein